MEKEISKFNYESSFGSFTKNVKCDNCNFYNLVTLSKNKSMTKKVIIKCNNCGEFLKLGDIYNFTTGKKLNKRLGNYFSHNVVDKNIWNKEYRKI